MKHKRKKKSQRGQGQGAENESSLSLLAVQMCLSVQIQKSGSSYFAMEKRERGKKTQQIPHITFSNWNTTKKVNTWGLEES